MLEIVILAAGKGTRMRSSRPKVMHHLAGKPLLQHVLERANGLSPHRIHVVVGHEAAQITSAFSEGNSNLNFVQQKEQLGTGHAVGQVLPELEDESTVLILYGDVPLMNQATLAQLVGVVNETALGLLTVVLQQPQGYGRIIRNSSNNVVAIVEQKDASQEQLLINEANTGVMAVKGKHLKQWLPLLQNTNAQGEYYLTDLIALASQAGVSVNSIQAESEFEVMGVNDRQQQAELERRYQRQLADHLLKSGLTLMDPDRFDCRGHLVTDEDCVIDVNCVFEGEVRLGKYVSIGANCCLKNTTIADHTVILANSIIEDSAIGANCTVGPFARLRPGSVLAEGAKIGNFVEIKNVHIGHGSKINHLSYVGDATIGSNVNLGAGTITCNYDGQNKYKTVIEDGVFVGSNTALVAPVTLSEQATIAAGSTVTNDVKAGQLAVARQRQRNIDGWQRPKKKD